MDHKSWRLPLASVPSAKVAERSVLWNNVHVCYEHTLFGQVCFAQYNNQGTQLGLVSSNQAVLMRVPQSEGCVWNEQLPRKCHSLRFRDDDRMIIQTVEQRVVIRSTETSFERQVQAHLRDARDALFLSKTTFASASDDCTVKIWDMPSQQELAVGKGHTDYVRSLALHSEGCFFSGSYDHSIMLWDVRMGLNTPASTIRQSEDPVERLVYVPSSSSLCFSAGDIVTVLDVRAAGGTPLYRQSHHTKAVTALAYSSKYDVLIAGSLDQRLKFISLRSTPFEEIATKKFDAGITACDVHPDSNEFAVGLATGKAIVLKVDDVAKATVDDKRSGEQEGVSFLLDQPKLSAGERQAKALANKMELVRRCLVSFKYHRALVTALYSRMDDVVLSTLEELQRRGALHVAMSGHNDRTVAQILRFATKHIDWPQFTDLMLTTLDLIFEIYASAATQSEFFLGELRRAQKRVAEVLTQLSELEHCAAVMELIVRNE